MSAREYDVVFVGGGLSALLLLKELRDALPERVAVIDPSPPQEEPPVHWSYWSRGQTFYDRFAIGAWWQARVADMPPESIAPFTMRLVRSTDVFAHMVELLERRSHRVATHPSTFDLTPRRRTVRDRDRRRPHTRPLGFR